MKVRDVDEKGKVRQINERQFEVDCANCGGTHLLSLTGMTPEAIEAALSTVVDGEDEHPLCPTCSAAMKRSLGFVQKLGKGRALKLRPTLDPKGIDLPAPPQPDPAAIDEIIVALGGTPPERGDEGD